MRRYIVVMVFSILYYGTYAQNHYNLVCRDFTFNAKPFSQGKDLRQIFEFVISNSKYPFKVLEREKMDKYFSTLQEERNLYKDLSQDFDKKLQLAGVDFLVLGDMNADIGTDNYKLIVNFIRVTGKDVTEKLPLIVVLNKDELNNTNRLKRLFDSSFESFVGAYFVSKQENNSLLTIPTFYKELEKRDSIISVHQKSLNQKDQQLKYLDSTVATFQKDAAIKTQTINNLSNSVVDLQNSNTEKDKEISSLNENLNGIKQYSNVAMLDVLGRNVIYDETIFVNSSPLIRLMKKVFQVKDSGFRVNMDDSSLIAADEVIKGFPQFPFSYWAKMRILLSKRDPNWLDTARKAKQILEITTTIVGHKPDHDLALNDIKKIFATLKIRE